jgi:hypothetical protein
MPHDPEPEGPAKSHRRRIPFHDPLLAERVQSPEMGEAVRVWFHTRVAMDDITTRVAADGGWLRAVAQRIREHADTPADRAALVGVLVNGQLLWRTRCR